MNDKNSIQISNDDISNRVTKKVLLIKNMQSLPEEVVIKFIESKGKLIRTKNGKLKIAHKIK